MMPENEGAAAVFCRRSNGDDCEAVALGGQSVRRADALRGKKPVLREGASVLVSGQPARDVQRVNCGAFPGDRVEPNAG